MGIPLVRGMKQLQLPVEPESVRAARRFVGSLGLPEPPRQNAGLLVSEVVTNAVTHGDLSADDTIRVRARCDGDVRVEVCHRGSGFDASPRSGALDEVGGWGLPLLDALADDWGVRAPSGMTCVWFSCPIEAG